MRLKMTITRHNFLEDAHKMIKLFCCKNQNSDKTVGLNNLAAPAKVMPRSMQRLRHLGLTCVLA